MNLKLSEWASIAEIMGAGAIVLSLIFVGIEVRDNTDASYAAAYDPLLADFTEIRKDLATSADMFDVSFKSRQGSRDSLTASERYRMQLWEEALLHILERAYFYGPMKDTFPPVSNIQEDPEDNPAKRRLPEANRELSFYRCTTPRKSYVDG